MPQPAIAHWRCQLVQSGYNASRPDAPTQLTSSECRKDHVSEDKRKHPSPHSHEPQVGWIPWFENQLCERIVLENLVAAIVLPLKPRLHALRLEDAKRAD